MKLIKEIRVRDGFILCQVLTVSPYIVWLMLPHVDYSVVKIIHLFMMWITCCENKKFIY